jgi:uncharacterized protein (TIGR02271 family)
MEVEQPGTQRSGPLSDLREVSTVQADTAGTVDAEHETLVVPVIQEEMRVDRQLVETGRVRIHKRVTERDEILEEPVLQEEVQVERVPINRPVDGPLPIRYEGDTMIIPLLEEVMVVEKRLMLKEELHIRKRQFTGPLPQHVVLRSEEVEIVRVGPQTGEGLAPQDAQRVAARRPQDVAA